MKWADLSNGFCEGIVSGPPEYVNAFTSFAMTFYGLMGLFVSRNHNIMIRITSAMLAVTGVGSFLYHWTWYEGWGILDAVPMMISAYFGAFQMLDIILYKLIGLNQNDKRRYEYASGLLSLILMSMLLISLAISVSDDVSHWFTALFALPELLMAAAIIMSKRLLTTMDNGNEIKYAYKISYIGIGVAVFAALVWTTTEQLCPTNLWMRFLYAHGIWHITISLGMYFIMQFMVFIYSYHVGKNPYFVKGDTKLKKIFYTLVPRVDLGDPDISRCVP